jgi:hypothetical protein
MAGDNGNGVNVSGPGFGGGLKGPLATLAGVFLAFLIVVSYVGWEGFKEAVRASRENAAEIRAEIKQVGSGNAARLEAVEDAFSIRMQAVERAFYIMACTLQYPPEQRRAMSTASSVDVFVQYCAWLPGALGDAQAKPSRPQIDR